MYVYIPVCLLYTAEIGSSEISAYYNANKVVSLESVSYIYSLLCDGCRIYMYIVMKDTSAFLIAYMEELDFVLRFRSFIQACLNTYFEDSKFQL